MNKSEAFIFITSFSYIGAFAATKIGYPPMVGPSPLIQCMIYTLFAVALFVYYINRNATLGIILSIIYGVLAGLSFSGIQQWINYSGSSDHLGVAMALWDLVLAVAILTVNEE